MPFNFLSFSVMLLMPLSSWGIISMSTWFGWVATDFPNGIFCDRNAMYELSSSVRIFGVQICRSYTETWMSVTLYRSSWPSTWNQIEFETPWEAYHLLFLHIVLTVFMSVWTKLFSFSNANMQVVDELVRLCLEGQLVRRLLASLTNFCFFWILFIHVMSSSSISNHNRFLYLN